VRGVEKILLALQHGAVDWIHRLMTGNPRIVFLLFLIGVLTPNGKEWVMILFAGRANQVYLQDRMRRGD